MYCVLGQLLPTFREATLRNPGKNSTTDTVAHPGTLGSPVAPLRECRTPAPSTQEPIQLKASNADTEGVGKKGYRMTEIMAMQYLRI
jgi:hypothetical protein